MDGWGGTLARMGARMGNAAVHEKLRGIKNPHLRTIAETALDVGTNSLLGGRRRRRRRRGGAKFRCNAKGKCYKVCEGFGCRRRGGSNIAIRTNRRRLRMYA